MNQQRITLFFPIESRRKKTPPRRGQFLALPPSIVTGYLITCGESWMDFVGSCAVNGTPAPVLFEGSRQLVCFYSKSHLAFNFRCENCKSLGFPRALFLVSCGFRDLATKVFYGKNVFAVSIVDDTSPCHCPSAIINRSISIVPNLTRFPNGAIQFLALLIFSFEVCAPSYAVKSTRVEALVGYD